MTMNPTDRTLFQGAPGVDHTILRPTPGRRGVAAEGAPSPPPVPPAEQPIRAAAPAPQYAPVSPQELNLAGRLDPNHLTRAAATLLTVYRQTRQAPHHADVAGLHRRMQYEIRLFEEKARNAGVKPEIVLASRYLMCSVMDEAVLHTPWGEESAWGQHTLLGMFHNETFGGEKCFLILNRLMQNPAENLEVLELFYLSLALGFEGKYRLADRGRDVLEAIRTELYQVIRVHRADADRDLSANWKGLRAEGKPLSHRVPVWVLVSVFALLIFASFAALKYVARWQSEPVLEQLQALGPNGKEPGVARPL